MKKQIEMQTSSVLERIFEFSNFREFLSEYFQEQKKLKPIFSHRYFAKKVGYTSPSFLNHVMRGKRNLTLSSLEKLIHALGLKGKMAAYLKTLVLFNQAKTPTERLLLHEDLRKLRNRFTANQLEAEHFEYFETWYNPVIRELVAHAAWNGNYKTLGSLLIPPISGEKAMKSVENLCRMGLIKKKSNHLYQQASQAVLADQVPLDVRRNFRMEMLIRTMEALERSNSKIKPDPKHGPKAEHISGTTVAMSEATFNELSQMMDEFRKKILERAIEDEKVERVYQFSFFAFPLSARLTPQLKPGLKK